MSDFEKNQSDATLVCDFSLNELNMMMLNNLHEDQNLEVDSPDK
jgi:hypothetical protein